VAAGAGNEKDTAVGLALEEFGMNQRSPAGEIKALGLDGAAGRP
jgi:hypothetical protein